MSKPTVSVDKITVTIGSRKLELTLEEARQLKRVLDETLEPKFNYQPAIQREWERPYRWERPSPMWAQEPVTRPRLGEVTC